MYVLLRMVASKLSRVCSCAVRRSVVKETADEAHLSKSPSVYVLLRMVASKLSRISSYAVRRSVVKKTAGEAHLFQLKDETKTRKQKCRHMP